MFAPQTIVPALSKFSASPWSPYLAVAAFPIAGLICFPVMLLSGIVAALFPPLEAMVISVIGILLSAALLHRIGAYAQHKVRVLLGASMKRIDALLTSQGIITVAAIRMVPLAPFTIVNLVAGAIGVRFLDYMVGTALGLMPGTIMLCLFGNEARQVWRHPTSSRIIGAIGILVIWIGLSIALQRWAKAHHAGKARDNTDHG
jgi:uncharacterized membrane protein YdjX (TVP38/TMEM64 family)